MRKAKDYREAARRAECLELFMQLNERDQECVLGYIAGRVASPNPDYGTHTDVEKPVCRIINLSTVR